MKHFKRYFIIILTLSNDKNLPATVSYKEISDQMILNEA